MICTLCANTYPLQYTSLVYIAPCNEQTSALVESKPPSIAICLSLWSTQRLSYQQESDRQDSYPCIHDLTSQAIFMDYGQDQFSSAFLPI